MLWSLKGGFSFSEGLAIHGGFNSASSPITTSASTPTIFSSSGGGFLHSNFTDDVLPSYDSVASSSDHLPSSSRPQNIPESSNVASSTDHAPVSKSPQNLTVHQSERLPSYLTTSAGQNNFQIKVEEQQQQQQQQQHGAGKYSQMHHLHNGEDLAEMSNSGDYQEMADANHMNYMASTPTMYLPSQSTSNG